MRESLSRSFGRLERMEGSDQNQEPGCPVSPDRKDQETALLGKRRLRPRLLIYEIQSLKYRVSIHFCTHAFPLRVGVFQGHAPEIFPDFQESIHDVRIEL